MTFLFSNTYSFIKRLLKDVKQVGKRRRLRRFFSTSVIVAGLILLFLAVTFSGIGAFSTIQVYGQENEDYSVVDVPENVLKDAQDKSEELFGSSWQAEMFKEQLISAYEEAQNKDVVILFNSGGWGTNTIESSEHWMTILEGIEQELSDVGYSVTSLSYQRTYDSLQGKLHELKEMLTGYLNKADELAVCVDFLTCHDPNINVIISGESMGTIICDSAMNRLKNNEQVYSIQTGVPFWQRNTVIVRTMQLNHNGVVPDAFNRGDAWAILRSSAQALVGIEKEENRGEILGVISAPGHEYWWSSPAVSGEIKTFLSDNFDIKSSE
jgi:hypothetical protein